MTTATVATPATSPALTDNPLRATAEVKDLVKALAFVAANAPTKAHLRVLLGVRLSATADGLTLTTYDFEQSVTETIDGTGFGEALVPARTLQDFTKRLEPGLIELRVNDKATYLNVSQGDLTLSVPLLPLPDYPAPPSTAEATPFATVTGAQLAQLGRAGVAAGRDDTLPVLTGIYLEAEQGMLRAAATDRYRLAVVDTDVPTILVGAVNVPAKRLAFLIKHLGKQDVIQLSTITSDQEHTFLVLETSTQTITTRLLSGTFPRYRSLVPAEMAVDVVGDSPALLKALDQVGTVLADKAPCLVRIEVDHLVVSGGHEGDAKAEKKVAATVSDSRWAGSVTAYNPQYLADGISALAPKGQIRLALNSVTTPAILTEAGDSDRRFLYLLMPVRLSG